LAVRADDGGIAHVPETLLASMAPADRTSDYFDSMAGRAGQNVTVSADGSSASLHWRIVDAHVRRREIRGSFYADFFERPSARPRPAVVLFGGSEGNLYGVEQQAALLAAHGFPTLALAYFGARGLPQTLTRVPLEYFARALRWLGSQPGVDPHRLYVDGVSRGSEAALLLGVHYPQLVHGVVAMSTSDFVLCSYPACDGPAWTFGGRPIEFQDSQADANAPIPVERIRGRVLLVCGGADAFWHSCPMAQAIVERRRPQPTTLLEYPDAGHGVGDPVPNVPRHLAAEEGRTRLANDRARADAWPKLLRFLSG